jgi:hypothetical protein
MSDHGRQVAQIAGGNQRSRPRDCRESRGPRPKSLRLLEECGGDTGTSRQAMGERLCGRRLVPDTWRSLGLAEPDVVNAARDGLLRRAGGEAAGGAGQAEGEAAGEKASLGQS